MRQSVLASAFILLGVTVTLDAQQIHLLPLPDAEAEIASMQTIPEEEASEVIELQVEPLNEPIQVDHEIVVTPEPEISTYQQQLESQRESSHERRVRIAQEKGDARRARLAYQKSIGVVPLRPVVNSHAPMSNYSQTWYGGNAYVGPYNWIRQPAYRSWPGGYYHGYRRY